jgi:uncharacterized protein (UPF0332 family)
MKRLLAALVREGKIAIGEPREAIARSALDRSERSLASARAVLAIGNAEDAISLAYYAMYYSAQALLERVGVTCKNHTATPILLEAYPIDTGALAAARALRIDTQYSIDPNITNEDAAQLIATAERFIAESYAQMATIRDVEAYRKRIEALLE